MMWPLGGAAEAPALIVDDEVVTYGALAAAVDTVAARVLDKPGLVLLVADWTLDAVILHLACLQTGTPVLLVDPTLETARVLEIVSAYEPRLVVGASADEIPAYAPTGWQDTWLRCTAAHGTGDAQLIVLTSGSTGEPKGVAVMKDALVANAAAIIDRLEIDAHTRGITSLPLQYSFGLSVLHSHLAAGASLILTRHRPPARRFWELLMSGGVTHLAGITLTFELLERRLAEQWPPSLLQLAHSGAPMSAELQRRLVDTAAANDAAFFAMYGQTEFMTRITAADLVGRPDKVGSVGTALSGIALRVEGGVITVQSPSAMLGYVASAAELAALRDDGVAERFHGTGDLGELDDDGFLWIRGRTSRLCKPLGRRISLDEVERHLREDAGVEAIAVSVADRVLLGVLDDAEPGAVALALAKTLHLPPSAVAASALSVVPRTSGGKIDYATAATALDAATGLEDARAAARS
ncbi:class I adenylate-forming enzyme family protein [Kocuria salsicia]|uniref:class I adenylate-forming enzyme family protein n=1 Tax=Kocuria salsicia TaxID=664639 RepID=UPI0011A4E1D5|nr:AMP-binding protein [Kocuria salsicia]